MNKKSIDTIVWWIPFKKIRNDLRRYLEFIYLNNHQINFLSDEIIIENAINLTTEIKDTIKQKEIVRKNLRVVEIEVSSFCNRKCFFCPNSFIDRYTQNIELEEKLYLKVIKELALIDYSERLSFHRYNEPLANKELILKRIRQAREYLPNSNLVIFTNGDYLTREYLDELKLAGVNGIHLNCYFDKNEGFDIENIVKPKMNKIFKKLSLDYDEVYNDHIMYLVRLKYDGIDILYRARNFLETGFDRAGLLEDKNTTIRTKQCFSPSLTFNIDFNGNVMPCCNMRSDAKEHQNYILGNIKNNTIFEIFTNKKTSDLRAHLGVKGNKILPCQKCDM